MANIIFRISSAKCSIACRLTLVTFLAIPYCSAIASSEIGLAD